VHPPLTSSVSSPNILLSTLFSNTLRQSNIGRPLYATQYFSARFYVCDKCTIKSSTKILCCVWRSSNIWLIHAQQDA
jgi:hypothetical protein